MANDVIRAEFLLGAASPTQFPPTTLPEVAMVGRSNVGKSSLINSILRTGMVARVSSTPGKTQEINFFSTDIGVTFVDLPGYGYAAVSRERRSHFSSLVNTYVTTRNQLSLVMVLIDSRHDPQPLDMSMLEMLEHTGRPYVAILTKCDKCKPADVQAREQQVRDLLAQCHHAVDVLPTSARDGVGRAQLIGIIKRLRDNYSTGTA